jgi:UDP-glucuronate 4-epimerase
MTILVTDSAGFISSALSISFLNRGAQVLGIDNHNDYYDPTLKELCLSRHANHTNYTHLCMNLEDSAAMARLFDDHQFDTIVNLAAQDGVRYSLLACIKKLQKKLHTFFKRTY